MSYETARNRSRWVDAPAQSAACNLRDRLISWEALTDSATS